MTSDTAVTRARRRQRGTDRDATPQPAQHARPSTARIARSRIALISCVVLWMLYLTTVIVTLSRGGALVDSTQLLATTLFLVSVTALTFSACMYLLARAGALPRLADHRRPRDLPRPADARAPGRPVRAGLASVGVVWRRSSPGAVADSGRTAARGARAPGIPRFLLNLQPPRRRSPRRDGDPGRPVRTLRRRRRGGTADFTPRRIPASASDQQAQPPSRRGGRLRRADPACRSDDRTRIPCVRATCSSPVGDARRPRRSLASQATPAR